MTITVQISRQKLETILFNAFSDLVICRETPLETPGGETRWLSGVELQSVRIQQGTTGEESTRVALATGETPAGTSVTQSFTVPEAYAEFDYRVSTIRDTEVNAEQYENVESSVVTVRKPFYRVSVSSGAVSVITLGTESYDPTNVPNTNTKTEDLFRYTGSYGGTIILPRGYKDPSSIKGLSKSNVGYRLSPDSEALVIRVDYTPPDAIETGPNSGTVPAWESFYEQPGPATLDGTDLGFEYERELLEIEGRERMQRLVDDLKAKHGFSQRSIGAQWRTGTERVRNTQTGNYHALPTAGITARATGEVPDSCYWIDIDFDIESTERMRLLESWEPDYAPGRLKYTQWTSVEADGSETFLCNLITLFLEEVLDRVGGYVLGAPGELAASYLSDYLEEQFVTYDEFAPAASGKEVRYIDVGQTGTELGTITLSEMEVDTERLEMRFDGTVTRDAPGRARIQITHPTGWFYWQNACEFAPRHRPRKQIAIRNTGDKTLRICRVEKISDDPDDIYALDQFRSKRRIWLEPGGVEILTFNATLDEGQVQAPYDATYRLQTSIGPRLVDIEPATGLSEADYEDQIASKFWFDPRDCLSLEVWPWHEDIVIEDLLGQPGPWPWERPQFQEYHVQFRGMPTESSVVLDVGGEDRAQFRAIEGEVIGSVAGEQESLAAGLAVRLEGDPEGASEEPGGVFNVRRADWHLVEEVSLPGTAEELVLVQDTLWTVSEGRLLGFGLDNPLKPRRDQPVLVDDARQPLLWEGNLTVLRDNHIAVYASEGFEQTAVWDHDGLTQLRGVGQTLLGVGTGEMTALQVDPGGELRPVGTLDIPEATELTSLGDGYVASRSEEGLVLVDISEPETPSVEDEWAEEPISRIQSAGRALVALTPEGEHRLFDVRDGQLEPVGYYTGETRSLFAERNGQIAYTLSAGMDRIECFRVVPRPGIEEVGAE